ncbi:N-acetyltransferase family protein [Streptomyces sp. NA02950]|uniref:GNAT family N-acetyltransferase n=1 Tax=Streptomyces sp. NA02950 TaxID=2742137 RepID=UPI00159143E5|nr:GNAT family N-acetyltransferase [Streptomyces sp. NA02950]QKV93133.1 N-acetyltransferase family protein [Streptomyces sp. NA02950]
MVESAPVIRDATPSDLETVAAIYAHYVTETVATFDETPPTPADWARRLAELTERGLPFLVAETGTGTGIGSGAGSGAGGGIAGYAYAGPFRPKPAYRHTVEDSIYLAPGRTGAGLGRALLEPLLDRCARAGVRQVVAVIADSGDEASAALHRRFGFTAAGRLAAVGHKHGRWIDTVMMQRDLTAAGPGTAAGDTAG